MNATRLRQRAAILHAIRAWFHAHGYLEVATPVLVPTAATEEHLEAVPAAEGWLHTSPELAMKRVLASGLCRIYQITPCFRDEERGVHHAREFAMLEWYRAGAGSTELMDEVESLIQAAAAAVDAVVPPFVRRRVSDLLEDIGTPDDWFFTWVDRIEPTLTQPTIVYDYPPWQAALARLRGDVADRFEVYLSGLELANAFHEELDPAELRQRQHAANAARLAAGRSPHPVDESFLEAVGRMPRCSGIALGIDRLVMALTGAKSIDEVQVPAGFEAH
ncbi:MAG: EF-P lysine aminoacylase GenX [Myxococcota bacterium]|nr:EF-P lysine aminoacylase GenX [Myxococcota bacterium]